MNEVRGTVLAVNGKSTGKGPIYEVAFSDGQTYATFKNEIADAAKRLQGQPAVIQVTSKTKGQYTNYYLDSIEPGQGAIEGAPTPIPVSTTNTGGRSPEVEQRIVRQNVLGTAFNYAAQMGESEEFALGLAKRLYQIAYYGKEVPNTYEPAPETMNGSEIQKQVAEVVGSASAGTSTTPDW